MNSYLSWKHNLPVSQAEGGNFEHPANLPNWNYRYKTNVHRPITDPIATEEYVRATFRMRLATRLVALTSFLSLSACASVDDARIRLPEPTRTAHPKAVDAVVIPASAQQAVPGVITPKVTSLLPPAPPVGTQGTPLPITLPMALALSGANPVDIQIADERVRAAAARLDRANVRWLPNINFGVNYSRHDGQLQDIVGNVFSTNKSSLLIGAGPQAVVSLNEAVYAPLAAKQVVRAVRADAQTTRNDTVFSVAVAYFDVQQARGEVAATVDSLRRAEDLVARTLKLVPELAPEVEVNRAKAEAARRRQGVESAYERWQIASAELTRLLRKSVV